MQTEGYLKKSDFENLQWSETERYVDYGLVYENRGKVFKIIYENFLKKIPSDFEEFCKQNDYWLNDYALFMAIKDAQKNGDSALLEPVMKVDITVPEDYMGDVIGDVNSRRGRLEGMEDRSGMKVIHAFVPLSEMFGYATDLRSKTQGRGNFSMQFDHYEELPKNVQEQVIGQRAALKKD